MSNKQWVTKKKVAAKISPLLALLLVAGGFALTLPIAEKAEAADEVITTSDPGGASGLLATDLGASATTLTAGALTAGTATISTLTAGTTSTGALTTSSIQQSGVSALQINTSGVTTTQIGSTTGASSVSIQSAAGNVTVNSSGVSIQGTTPNSQINIGTQGGQVNIGNSSGGSTVNFNNNRLTGVAAGINGTDAVNVNQLNSAVNNLQNQINTNKAAIAGVVAATNLPGLQAGQTVNFGIAWGNYSNQNGMSVGGHVRLADEVVLKVSGSATSGVYSGGVGLGIGF